MSPSQFEHWVTEMFRVMGEPLTDLTFSLHEKIAGADGRYDFDATVRYSVLGLAFLVIVEAKQHKHPIKRELVQVLHQKVQSVGAHKGVMVATSPYQSGALEFAAAHGIALISVVDSRLVYETRGSRVVTTTQGAHQDSADDGGSGATGYALAYDPTTRTIRRSLLSSRSASEMIEVLELPITNSVT